MTINSGNPVPASLGPATRAELIKLVGRLIDVLGVDEARALTPTLVGYLSGPGAAVRAAGRQRSWLHILRVSEHRPT